MTSTTVYIILLISLAFAVLMALFALLPMVVSTIISHLRRSRGQE